MQSTKNPFAPGVGGVVSADIAVPEHEREVSFYSSVLTTGEDPLWRDDLMNNQGMPIIGLGLRTPEYEVLPKELAKSKPHHYRFVVKIVIVSVLIWKL